MQSRGEEGHTGGPVEEGAHEQGPAIVVQLVKKKINILKISTLDGECMEVWGEEEGHTGRAIIF